MFGTLVPYHRPRRGNAISRVRPAVCLFGLGFENNTCYRDIACVWAKAIPRRQCHWSRLVVKIRVSEDDNAIGYV